MSETIHGIALVFCGSEAEMADYQLCKFAYLHERCGEKGKICIRFCLFRFFSLILHGKVKKKLFTDQNMAEKNFNRQEQQSVSRRGGVPRLVIRVGNGTLSFLLPHEDGRVEFSPYTVRSGVSMAANLRSAFRDADMLADHGSKALLSVCSPVVLVPMDEYMDDEEYDVDTIYSETFVGHSSDVKERSILPDLNAVAIYGVNKDLRMVVEDHFKDVRVQNVMQPVWTYLYRRSSLNGRRRKLYGYFHDKRIDVFSFQQRRFRFANSFDAAHLHDALYYLLFVWKQLAFDNEEDELYLVGDIPDREWMVNKLRSYLRRVYMVNPSSELNRLPVTQIEGVDFDMML